MLPQGSKLSSVFPLIRAKIEAQIFVCTFADAEMFVYKNGSVKEYCLFTRDSS